jgi:hypothetical protein
MSSAVVCSQPGMCGKPSVEFGGYVCLHAPLGSLQPGSALHED